MGKTLNMTTYALGHNLTITQEQYRQNSNRSLGSFNYIPNLFYNDARKMIRRRQFHLNNVICLFCTCRMRR